MASKQSTVADTRRERKLDAFAEYLCARRGLAECTIHDYVGTIRRLSPTIGLNPPHPVLDAFIVKMRKAGASYSHVVNTSLALERYTEFIGNPIHLGRPKKPKRMIRGTLTEAEITLMLAACRNIREKAILTLLAYSGIEMPADLILLDERDGRIAAERAALRVTGLLGVLLRAKKDGQIQAVKPEVEALCTRARFFVSPQVERKIPESSAQSRFRDVARAVQNMGHGRDGHTGEAGYIFHLGERLSLPHREISLCSHATSTSREAVRWSRCPSISQWAAVRESHAGLKIQAPSLTIANVCAKLSKCKISPTELRVMRLFAVLSTFFFCSAGLRGQARPLPGPTGAGASEQTLDRFGGDTRLTSKVHNAGVTFSGVSTGIAAHELTDGHAGFPADGRLAGKLMNPNIKRPESSASPEKWFRILRNTAAVIYTDPADGDLRQFAQAGDSYHVTGVFTTEKIGDRWWFIDPEGNVFFPRAVALTDMRELYSRSHPSLQRYDAIYLQTSDGKFTENLARQAEDPTPADVINASGVTLRIEGDSLYIGAQKPFNVSYFYLQQPGAQGRIEWYYSSNRAPGGWALLNGNGNPAEGAAINADGSFNLDAGGYLGPAANGTLKDRDPKANRIHWWHLGSKSDLGNQTLFPADFAPVSVSADPLPRYYLKGAVTRAFATPPVLTQLYDTPSPADILPLKYAAPGSNPYFNWFQAVNRRFRAWGWNTAGYYSGQYIGIDGNFPEDRLPVEPTATLSTIAMQARQPYHIKNVYEGVQCPPGSGKFRYKGHQADAFEPGYAPALDEIAAKSLSSNPWNLFIIPEEGDDVFGINRLGHDHLGYAVVSQNPYKPLADGVQAAAPIFYAKFALRDFLRARYKPQSDPLPALTIASTTPAYTYSSRPTGSELRALQNLNTAWGASYTTWGTSSGEVEKGSNAWGSGTGFLDENGRAVMTDRCNLAFDQFEKPGFSKVKEDLDAFLGFFTRRYGSILHAAVKAHTVNLMILPLYDPPGITAAAMSEYTDLVWTTAPTVSAGQRIYNALRKPLVLADYLTAAHDTAQDFGGRITAVSYDAARNTTRVTWLGRPYKFRKLWPIEFPDIACKGVSARPALTSVAWNSLEVSGNYARDGCVTPGQRVGMAGRPGAVPSQADRARTIEEKLDVFTRAVGDDGAHFVAGFEHWAYMDRALLDPYEFGNFGLVTTLDNAYDGSEARQAVGKDRSGRFVGGEDADYGDLLGPLSKFLHGLYSRFIGGVGK